LGIKSHEIFILSKTSGEKKLVGGQLVGGQLVGGLLEPGENKLDTELVITVGIVAMQRQ
jgi:hypothetical protein